MVEYVVLAALVALVITAALVATGTSLREVFCAIASRGGGAMSIQECMASESEEDVSDSPCTGSFEECGLSTPTVVPTFIETPNPTVGCDEEINYRQCPSSPMTFQRCVRARDVNGNCVETCEPCPVTCSGCTLSPAPCPSPNSMRLAPVITDNCRCEYDWSFCE